MSYKELYLLYKEDYEMMKHSINEVFNRLKTFDMMSEYDKDCALGDIREIVPDD